MIPSDPHRRTALGRSGQIAACAWLRTRGFLIHQQGWRPPTGSGAGEVDIIASLPEAGGDFWLIEVKTHRAFRNGEGRLVSPAQLRRMRAARGYFREIKPFARVHVALLWIDPETEKVEFLENP